MQEQIVFPQNIGTLVSACLTQVVQSDNLFSQQRYKYKKRAYIFSTFHFDPQLGSTHAMCQLTTQQKYSFIKQIKVD